jgi:phage tail protein X
MRLDGTDQDYTVLLCWKYYMHAVTILSLVKTTFVLDE